MGALGEISRRSWRCGGSDSRIGRGGKFVARALIAAITLPAFAQAQAQAQTQTQTQTQTPKVVSARLELTLPENCGTAEWFIERIRMRSDRIRFHPDEKSLVVRSRVSVVNSGLVRAQMSLQQPDGSQAERVIEASTCEQALDGLALVTAVTLDPTADPSPAPATLRPERPLNPSGPVTTGKTPRKAPPLTPPAKDEAPQSLRDRRGNPYGLWAAANVMGLDGPSPNWMIGPEVTVGIESEPHAPFSVSARLALAHLFRDGIVADGGVADFSLTHASLELCPIRFGSSPLVISACAEAMVGRIRAIGRLTTDPEEHHRTFSAAGGSCALTIRISNDFSIPVRGFALFPFVRDTYQFAPNQFFHTPAATIGVAAGISVRFW